ncbi:glycoside hydrolase family 3 N-terminal domain-containing protein [Niameybacter massiliensis]|uniref:glycoside hydrolase family 3 N-terminal domain-containing protein n=1 Tax=Niameybacter massiliensis TaxID=1658108 RepID=UPI0006B5BD59|nr:glycoside hydrolase family 3 N-terminal domain-containing protein [Niameybacter massiliensis]
MSSERIEALITKMTIEEKLGQMTQLSPFFWGVEDGVDITGPLEALSIDNSVVSRLGSTLNYFGADKLKKLQDDYLEKSRLKIPMLFMADVIYGYKTVFPIPLALSCSFNPQNYHDATQIVAKESAASGIHLTFAPMSDLVRDPRWGRVMESPGEDPYLNAMMTEAAVRGFQGDSLNDKGTIAACVKHFAGYGASQGGRDYNWVELSKHSLWQYYLPSYKAAVDAGVKMVMTAFNVIDGIPTSANKSLFRDILRDKWGFKGVTISDYGAIDETVINGLVKDGYGAAKACIEAGIDIEMMSTHYVQYGKKLVEEGRLSIDLINQATRNILMLKEELGLFDNPYRYADAKEEQKLHKCKEHLKRAREIARESIVLLKNNQILPLEENGSIGMAGPFVAVDSTMGGWVLGDDKNSFTLEEAIREKGFDVITSVTKGLGAMQDGCFDIEDWVEEEIKKLEHCDVIIVGVGENAQDTGEGASKTNIRLSYNQEKLIYRLKQLNKPLIAIIFSGRPLEIKPIVPVCDAIIEAWFLGTESSGALADVITGVYNPSGRLAMSFPQTVGQIPVHYNCYNTGRPYSGKDERYISRYLDCSNEPLYPFGYGLSYGETEYTEFKVETVKNKMIASVIVINKSNVEIKETVQLYIRDVYATVVRPIKELKGFRQIVLKGYEKQRVEFEITKEMLKFYRYDYEYVFEEGEFDIMIGKNSADTQMVRKYIS